MATEFLNCGSPDVEQAAEEWAAANGYEVIPGSTTTNRSWGAGLPDYRAEGITYSGPASAVAVAPGAVGDTMATWWPDSAPAACWAD